MPFFLVIVIVIVNYPTLQRWVSKRVCRTYAKNMLLNTKVRWHCDTKETHMVTGSDGPCSKIEWRSTAPKQRRTISRPGPEKLCLISIKLSLFVSIQRCTSVMHISSLWAAVITSCAWHQRYSWVSVYVSVWVWVYIWCSASCAETTSARSAMYKINNHGPRTEPWGTEQGMITTADFLPAYTIWNVLSGTSETTGGRHHVDQTDIPFGALCIVSVYS